MLSITRVSHLGLSLGGLTPGVVILISDPARQPPDRTQILTSVFGLTPAEVRVAIRVCDGMSLPEMAYQLEISVNTAKTQLRSIFNRTGCSRQTELVKLLANFRF